MWDLEFLEAQTVTGDQLSRAELEADRGLGVTFAFHTAV